jgi:thioredoxin reductase
LSVESFRIAIVGAGPGGLSAAARAAELGVSHVLLEQSPAHANTIQRYQKGKHVMAEPNVLPLRSPLPFAAGVRENILDEWAAGLERLGVNLRCESEVTRIEGERGQFVLTLKTGETLHAAHVIFSIGVQGNPRRLGVPGDDLPCVQYTLDDPDEYQGETIIVVGAGDAAIENAVALAKQNRVFIVNRAEEFARIKDGNLSLVLKAIEDETLGCFYKSSCVAITATTGAEAPYLLTLATPEGDTAVPCHRIIARIGAVPPRKFVESCGIRFPSSERAGSLRHRGARWLSAHQAGDEPGLRGREPYSGRGGGTGR